MPVSERYRYWISDRRTPNFILLKVKSVHYKSLKTKWQWIFNRIRMRNEFWPNVCITCLLYLCSDIKKKLRMALCSADSVVFHIIPLATTRNGLPDHADSEGYLSILSSIIYTCLILYFLQSCNMFLLVYNNNDNNKWILFLKRLLVLYNWNY